MRSLLGRRFAAAAIALASTLWSTAASAEPDPWEGWNRPIFSFNEAADRWVLDPVAETWDFLVPDPAERGLFNVFDNLAIPVIFANELLQLKPRAAGQDLGRLLVNSTLGVAGLFDVATRFGIPKNDNDFGLTLGVWGIPSGPYAVLPLFGPSNPRDAVGLVADSFASPYSWFIPLWVSISVRGVDMINDRSHYDDQITDERKAALDFYVFVRDAYIQNRRFKLQGRRQAEPVEDDFYYYEDEDWDDESGDESSAPDAD
jgi:phospholipid-binding lipoprotein MlaA